MRHIATSFEQEIWGILLIVITVIVHAIGMGLTTSVSKSLQLPASSTRRALRGIKPLTVAFAMVLAVHLIEVIGWVGFFLWRNSVWTASAAYRKLIRDSGDLLLLVHWQLLASFLAVLTLLWSGIVLVTLSRSFEEGAIAADSGAG